MRRSPKTGRRIDSRLRDGLGTLRDTDRDALRADVAVMRELGVDVWGDITLGPDPKKPPPLPQRHPHETPEERVHRTMFAHSSIRPPLVKAPARDRDVPRAVAQRPKDAEAMADGEEAQPARARRPR